MSDRRGQEENHNDRQLSCHFIWKTMPVPRRTSDRFALVRPDYHVHFGSQPPRYLTRRQMEKRWQKEGMLQGRVKVQQRCSLRLWLALRYPVTPIPVPSASLDPPRPRISWLKWHKTSPYQVELTDLPLPSHSQIPSRKG